MTPRERAWSSVRGLLDRSDHEIVGRVEAAILADRAEQAAGEAERVREAVAREREACAVLCETWTNVYPGASYARGCAARIRARATSPAPEPHPAGRAAADAAKAARARGEDVYADGEGRAVIEAAEARMREAVDALAAARKGAT